jgi:hypothetical protein
VFSLNHYAVVFVQKLLLSKKFNSILEVGYLELKLVIDGKEIPLNEFVNKILAGTMVGAVTSLRGVKEDWKKIEVEITK